MVGVGRVTVVLKSLVLVPRWTDSTVLVFGFHWRTLAVRFGPTFDTQDHQCGWLFDGSLWRVELSLSVVSWMHFFHWQVAYLLLHRQTLAHKPMSKEEFLDSIPPKVKSVASEVFFLRKTSFVPDVGRGAFISASKDRSYMIWWWQLTPQVISLYLCASINWPTRNSAMRCHFELFEATLYRTVLSHVTSDDTGEVAILLSSWHIQPDAPSQSQGFMSVLTRLLTITKG